MEILEQMAWRATPVKYSILVVMVAQAGMAIMVEMAQDVEPGKHRIINQAVLDFQQVVGEAEEALEVVTTVPAGILLMVVQDPVDLLLQDNPGSPDSLDSLGRQDQLEELSEVIGFREE